MISILNYIWLVPAGLIIMIVSTDIITPNKKWIIRGLFILIGIIIDVLVIFDPINSFDAIPPHNPGETIIYEY